jgi:hypothetical protein
MIQAILKKSICYFFTLVIIFNLFACAKKKKEEFITQRWTIGQVDFGRNLPEESKAAMEPMMAQMKENSYLNFHKDYSFEGFAMGMNAHGTWNINDDGTEIYLLDKKTKREEKIVIDKLTKDSLVFSAEAQGQPLKFTFVPGK